ncbi:MAG: signal recognition particle-docking protein FtsY [Actinobacteria bacterium]|nr:signal recognition particle-docking protein FtsY [Actinomycetota bacterium]
MNSGLIYAGVALLVVVIAIITVLVLRRRSTATIAYAPDAVAVVAEQLVAEEISTTLEVEIPAAAAGRLHRLRARLARSNNAIGKGLLALLSAGELTDSTWDQVEETLLMADLGVGPTQELIARLRTRVQVAGTATPEQIKGMLREELLILVDPMMDRSIVKNAQGRPAVILVVGVNGTGKTTTTGKLARLLIADGKTVVLGAADTFRAAAADQLQTWGDRVGASVVRGPEASDPAAVAFDAVNFAAQFEADTVVIDTAGRLHTKTGLMDELGKVKRVIEKKSPVDEILLVLDATTGQNGLAQARVFQDVVDITGIALTKLDGTARGGIVVAVQRELGVPVKLVGLGEGPDDLAPFDPIEFVEALVGDS